MPPSRNPHGETEYRRSFKKSRFTCSATTYQRNLDFRTEQKRRFVEHNREPFDWNPEDTESDSDSKWSCSSLNRPPSLTQTQYKHEKFRRLYDRRMRRQTGDGEADANEVVPSRLQSQTEPGSDDDADVESGDEEESEAESGSGSEASVVHIIQPEFVEHRPIEKRVTSKQTQTDGQVAKHSRAPSLSPFVPYGYEAQVKETGTKMTHNVLAAKEIYPSALRAQTIRKSANRKNRDNIASANPKRSHDPLRQVASEPTRIFIHSDEYDCPDWVSEYDRNYKPYSANEYRNQPSSARVHARELVPHVLGKTRKKTKT